MSVEFGLCAVESHQCHAAVTIPIARAPVELSVARRRCVRSIMGAARGATGA